MAAYRLLARIVLANANFYSWLVLHIIAWHRIVLANALQEDLNRPSGHAHPPHIQQAWSQIFGGTQIAQCPGALCTVEAAQDFLANLEVVPGRDVGGQASTIFHCLRSVREMDLLQSGAVEHDLANSLAPWWQARHALDHFLRQDEMWHKLDRARTAWLAGVTAQQSLRASLESGADVLGHPPQRAGAMLENANIPFQELLGGVASLLHFICFHSRLNAPPLGPGCPVPQAIMLLRVYGAAEVASIDLRSSPPLPSQIESLWKRSDLRITIEDPSARACRLRLDVL